MAKAFLVCLLFSSLASPALGVTQMAIDTQNKLQMVQTQSRGQTKAETFLGLRALRILGNSDLGVNSRFFNPIKRAVPRPRDIENQRTRPGGKNLKLFHFSIAK